MWADLARGVVVGVRWVWLLAVARLVGVLWRVLCRECSYWWGVSLVVGEAGVGPRREAAIASWCCSTLPMC